MRQAQPEPNFAPQPLAVGNDSGTDLAAALQAAREYFAAPMDALRTLLAGRDPSQLIGHECVQHLTLRERFHELATAQRNFAEAAHLSRRSR
jgi:hypothetical protein